MIRENVDNIFYNFNNNNNMDGRKKRAEEKSGCDVLRAGCTYT